MMGNWSKQHGWGILTTTTSWLPGYITKSKTLDVKEGETLTGLKPHDPDPVPASFKHKKFPFKALSLKKSQVTPAPGIHSKGSDNPGFKAKLLSSAPHKITYDLGTAGYTRLIKDEKYFPNLSAKTAGDLESAIMQATIRVPPRPNLPKKLHGANAMVLTQAISLISKERPNGVDDVIRGLACLQNIDLLAAIRAPENATATAINGANPVYTCPRDLAIGTGGTLHANANFDEQDLDCAWRLAQVLGSSPAGFDLLTKISALPGPANNVHPSVRKHDLEMLHVYLDGTRELVAEARNPLPPAPPLTPVPPTTIPNHPNAIDRALRQAVRRFNGGDVVNPGQNGAAIPGNVGSLTVLQKGLLAVHDHLAQSAVHAGGGGAANPFDIPAANLNGNSWAITFIRNGIYTDALRDANGDPTPYALLNGRTDKVVTWAQRAYTRADAWRPKWGAALKSHFLPYKEKTPFNAYNRLGEDDEAVGFKQAERTSGIAEGRVVKENLIHNVMLALRASGGGTYGAMGALNLPKACVVGTPNTQPTIREMTSIVRLAILEETLAQTKILPRFKNGAPLDSVLMENVKNRVYAHCGGTAVNRGNLSDGSLTRLEQALQNENNGYDPQTLINWAGEVGGPATVAAAVQGAGQANPVANQPDWADFGTGIDHVVNGNVPIPAAPNLNKVNPNNVGGALLTRDERINAVADRFEDAIAHQELGQRFTFSSGGKAGLKTGGLSHLLTAIPSFGLVRGKANVGYERARKAVFDGGTFTTGNELIFATETAHKESLGGGLTVGPGKLAKELGSGWSFGATAGGDIGGANEHSNRRGAVLRFRRTHTSSDGDQKQNVRLGRLARKMIDPATAHSDGAPWVNPGAANDQSSLKKACQEFPDLSVSWMDARERTLRGTASLGAGAGIFAGIFRLGLAGVNGNLEGRTTKHTWREKGGSLHVEKNTTIKGFKTSATVAGPLIAGIPGAASQLGLPGLALGEAGWEFHKSQFTQRDSFIWDDGTFHPRTYRTKTFANANDLYHYAAKQLADMAADKARYYNAQRYHPELEVGADAANLSYEEAKAKKVERQILLDFEYRTLKQHLQEQLRNAELNQVFQLYYEPKPDVVDTVNYVQSIGANALLVGDKEGAKQCAEQIDKLLASEEAWHHGFFVDHDATSVSRSLGLNVLGVNQGIEQAEFSRIRNWT